MKLILIRHTSLAIEPGICYGQSDIDVSKTFLEEAAIVHSKIAQYLPDLIYTSPMQRCRKLAAFCGYPDAIIEPKLLELNFGDWEGQKWHEINDPHLNVWYDNWLNTPTTNGESFMMQYQRYESLIQTLQQQHSDKTIALFTHGGILHCARIHSGIDQFHNTFDDRPDYGEVIVIDL